MRGTNDEEFSDFAKLTLTRDATVRFIEYMPLGDAALLRQEFAEPQATMPSPGPSAGCGSQNRGPNAFIPEPEIREHIEHQLGPLIPIDRSTESGVGPAIPYRLALGNPRGRIGFISAMSQPFCSTCNRLRLTADGTLRSCLFEGGEVPIREILRDESHKSQRHQLIADAMTQCVRQKPLVHTGHGNRQMSQIGG
jgi:cyclic pyranopterin phosphate synthase